MTDPENEPAPGEEPGAGDGNNTSTPKPTSKPKRAPWEDEPWVDQKAATERAIGAARAPKPVADPKSLASSAWAKATWDKEIGPLTAATEGERQKLLFPAACNLYEIVAAGVWDEHTVTDALREACRANRLEQDDGELSVVRTIKNARRRGFDNPRDLSNVGKYQRPSGCVTDDEPEPLVLNDFQHLERGFWMERDSLKTIYMAALSRLCSPWAVLAHVVAIVLGQVRPHITLPPIVGGKASLNWFGAVVAPSSGGKGAAASVAAELIPHTLPVLNLGSGEGLVDAFVRPANKDTGEPAGLHESLLFVAHEIDGLKALAQRHGSTLMPVLRSAFFGEAIGFSNRQASRLHLAAHSYRMTLVLSAQPARCEGLLGDTGGGTPQRFQWFPGVDDRITDQPPPWPGKLTLPSPSTWAYPTTLKVPFEAVELIRAERARAARGEADNESDGHKLLVREKLAFALAVLDKRHGPDAMRSDDWRLAGVAIRVSDHMRAYVAQQVDQAAVSEAEKRGTERGIEFDAANTERTQRDYRRRRRIENWVVGKLREAEGGSITEGALRGLAAGRDKPHIEPTLARMQESGEVEQVLKCPGDQTPRWTLSG